MSFNLAVERDALNAAHFGRPSPLRYASQACLIIYPDCAEVEA